MEEQKIYKKIRDIAHRLNTDKATYTRADLAYDLRDLGVENDSAAVSAWVWEAYQQYNNDKAIRSAFYDNDKRERLVDAYQVDALIESGDNGTLFPLLENKLAQGSSSLDTLDRLTVKIMKGGSSNGNTGGVMSVLTGTQGIEKVRGEAMTIFDKYSQLIGSYDEGKCQIRELITDFVKLRTYVLDVYREYAMILTDAFGEGVKSVAPELFDFDTVEWLDTQGMLQQVQLDYNKITEKCSALMGDISESFKQSLTNSASAYRASGSKGAALMVAGLNMVSHYLDAGQKTAELQQDLAMLKNSVKHDVTLIKGDLGRLWLIYRTLNDIHIPMTETFCRYSREVLSEEWRQLEESLYADEGIRQLKRQRDNLLAETKELEKEIADRETNIGYYTARVGENEQLLDSMKEQYTQAKQSKPGRPFFLLNLLTLGAAGQRYNRDIFDWNRACKPVITRFEDLQIDVKLDRDELNTQQAELNKDRKQYAKLKEELQQQNKAILKNIKVRRETRLKMLPHLESIIKLLRLAREIANSKLDEKLTKRVSIERHDMELPPELRQNIETFTRSIAEAGKTYAQPGEATAVTDGNTTLSAPTETDIATAKAIDKVADLFGSWVALQAMQEKNAVNSKIYDEELSKLQHDFQKELQRIDNKNALLRESLRRINTAENHEQLKEGLLSLAGKDLGGLTEKDWNEFLEGNKTIEL